jgi:carbonic anhydrase
MSGRLGFAVTLTMLSQSLLAQDRPVIHHYFSKTPPQHAASWGYAGLKGPAHWGTLDPSYRLASDGRHQSPVNINSKQAPVAELPELKFDYRRENITVLNNGHTIQHNESPGSFLYVGDQRFALEQFHMHAPSEHTVDGKHFDIESSLKKPVCYRREFPVAWR